MQTKTSTSAFTLIELLAVVAIILLLLSLLIPALSNVRERGNRSVCFSNIRQLQIAFNMCTVDRDGLLPSSATGGANAWSTTADLKLGIVWPYLLNEKLYSCPSYPVLPSGVLLKRNYSMATRVGSADWAPASEMLRSMSSVRQPSRTHIFVEEYDNRMSTAGVAPGPLNGFAQNRSGYNAVDCLPNWHNMGANFSYLDGHVEYRRWEGPAAKTINCYNWFFSQYGMSFAGTAEDKADWDFIRSGINSAY